jgi:hypothetical protein
MAWDFCSSLPSRIWKNEGHRNATANKEPPTYPTKEQLCHDNTMGHKEMEDWICDLASVCARQ